jgi:hypothetical protein
MFFAISTMGAMSSAGVLLQRKNNNLTQGQQSEQ